MNVNDLIFIEKVGLTDDYWFEITGRTKEEINKIYEKRKEDGFVTVVRGCYCPTDGMWCLTGFFTTGDRLLDDGCMPASIRALAQGCDKYFDGTVPTLLCFAVKKVQGGL